MSFSYQLVADTVSPLDGATVTAPFVLKIEGDIISYIPKENANTDYQEYLAWLAEGNEPLPADD